MPEDLAIYVGRTPITTPIGSTEAIDVGRVRKPRPPVKPNRPAFFHANGADQPFGEESRRAIRRRPSESLFLERPHRVLAARKRPYRGSTLRQRHDFLLKELRLAEQVQRSMLPREMPKLAHVEFGAALRPTQHLAGDFYNVIRLDRDRVGVCLGDVMGHGPAAALLGVFAMQGLRTKTIEGSSYEILAPAEVLSALSRDLMRADFHESPFVTMIYGVVDTSRNVFTYCCGGHPPALLLRDGRPHQLLEGRSSLLGVFDLAFEQDEIPLLPGDRVVMYSDGADSIVWGTHGVGIDGIVALLSQRDGRSSQALIDEAMMLAQPGNGPSDDLTLVMFEMRQ